ncbi:MAG TPA: tail fiber protein [Rhizomicrobium sp.]|jgi:microcystin-dependent protein|nr:tail fiber protein [Rhizomicrobium sp.]
MQFYVGQLMMFAGNFAPAGWMACQGQLIPISEYETLFNLIGTTYGGDGQSTFGLPDLQGRVAVHQGQGGGLSNYVIGQKSGTETVTLNIQQIPQHNHMLTANAAGGNQSVPAGNSVLATEVSTATGGGNAFTYAAQGGAQATMANTSIGFSGGSQPHDNIQPILAITYCISMFGVYPSQN